MCILCSAGKSQTCTAHRQRLGMYPAARGGPTNTTTPGGSNVVCQGTEFWQRAHLSSLTYSACWDVRQPMPWPPAGCAETMPSSCMHAKAGVLTAPWHAHHSVPPSMELSKGRDYDPAALCPSHTREEKVPHSSAPTDSFAQVPPRQFQRDSRISSSPARSTISSASSPAP
jgi:hypothetical protein